MPDERSFDDRFLATQDALELGSAEEADAASLELQRLMQENPNRAKALIQANAARTIERALAAVLAGSSSGASVHIPTYEDDPDEAEEWAAAMWQAFEKSLTEAVERFVASYPLGDDLGVWQAREALDNVASALDGRAEAGIAAEQQREDPRAIFSTRPLLD